MKNILVVDDNIASLKEIAVQLKDYYAVSLAKSGTQALEVCVRRRPDLILLDVRMSGMDGFETIERIKENPVLSDIPVFFITGDKDMATEVRGLKSGAVDFITKPVERSILLHRIELHLRFSSYRRQLAKTVMEMENSLATAFADLIECRDENTGGHVVRTGKYVDALGNELMTMGVFDNELSDEGLELMVRAAPLHDIGKIVISDRYLLKPGRLNDEEFAVMKRHAVIGAEILDNMYTRMPTQTYLKYARLIAASHHERYDGAGYPDRLAGDEIPLCGRIMAVADVYDALVCDRVYRAGFSHAQAYGIIMEGRGTQFDPRVVDAFESCHKRFMSLAIETGGARQ
ncbi:MAG: response regulator [Synergistaceae bacterium]|jgi:putative two-component system response regulator|nr:response regulator [Synergistaceae bacterium]